MLFFKDIKAELLDEPKFRAFYEAECHVCITTMALVSRLEEMGDEAGPLLDRLGIPLASFRALADGEYCDPEEVERLTHALGMDRPGLFESCPRSARNIDGVICKKEGRGNGRQ